MTNYSMEPYWCTGLDLNQRRQCRQIYSLLPLTTRPPVHIYGGEGEIRTHGTFPYDSFQDCSLNPLGHFSMVAENGVKPFQTWTQFHAVLLCNIGCGGKSRTCTRRAYETRVSAIWTTPPYGRVNVTRSVHLYRVSVCVLIEEIFYNTLFLRKERKIYSI